MLSPPPIITMLYLPPIKYTLPLPPIKYTISLYPSHQYDPANICSHDYQTTYIHFYHRLDEPCYINIVTNIYTKLKNHRATSQKHLTIVNTHIPVFHMHLSQICSLLNFRTYIKDISCFYMSRN